MKKEESNQLRWFKTCVSSCSSTVCSTFRLSRCCCCCCYFLSSFYVSGIGLHALRQNLTITVYVFIALFGWYRQNIIGYKNKSAVQFSRVHLLYSKNSIWFFMADAMHLILAPENCTLIWTQFEKKKKINLPSSLTWKGQPNINASHKSKWNYFLEKHFIWSAMTSENYLRKYLYKAPR